MNWGLLCASNLTCFLPSPYKGPEKGPVHSLRAGHRGSERTGGLVKRSLWAETQLCEALKPLLSPGLHTLVTAARDPLIVDQSWGQGRRPQAKGN